VVWRLSLPPLPPKGCLLSSDAELLGSDDAGKDHSTRALDNAVGGLGMPWYN
jgi:hypothetical protein